jgi:hypothetical protein
MTRECVTCRSSGNLTLLCDGLPIKVKGAEGASHPNWDRVGTFGHRAKSKGAKMEAIDLCQNKVDHLKA